MFTHDNNFSLIVFFPDARTPLAFAPRAGRVPGVRTAGATSAAASMGNARTGPASASQAGTGSTVPWRAAPRPVHPTGRAKQIW
jgi:hypothetical protein